MPCTKRWDKNSLRVAVKKSISIRQVLLHLNLVEAGGNYEQIKKYILLFKIDTSHFWGYMQIRVKNFLHVTRFPLKNYL